MDAFRPSAVEVAPLQSEGTLYGFMLLGCWPQDTVEWAKFLVLAVRMAAVPGLLPMSTVFRVREEVPDQPQAGAVGLVVAEDQTGLPVTLGKTALPSINVQFISDVLVEMQAKKVAVTGVVLPKATNEVDLRVAGVPYLVKFNLRGDARAEAGTYLATKQYLESRGKTPGEYVDVRVDGKAYYR